MLISEENLIFEEVIKISKKIYVIRHCEAVGQSPNAHLTDKGYKQALDLSSFFTPIKVDRMIASPYTRAIDSIQPLAKQLNLHVESDRRLKERILSTENLSDWLGKLENTFEDPELKFEGGKSSSEALKRIVEVVEEVFSENNECTIIVTHGNLMSLLFNYYDKNFGFDNWKSLNNPDVFLLTNENNRIVFKRVWR